jgi:hypothetical protein
MAQEKLIEDSPIPHSIIHATQFFEFAGRIADGHQRQHGAPGTRAHPAHGRRRRGQRARGRHRRPASERHHRDRRAPAIPPRRPRPKHATRTSRPRKVITDPHATYYGAELHERTLVPAVGARLARTRFDQWQNQSTIGNS